MPWTGATKRLDRLGRFNDRKAYAFEELVAEIGNCMLCVLSSVQKKEEPMEIKSLTSPPLADGISVIPGERIAQSEETLLYLGVPDTRSQILIAERESGERFCVHAADCRVPD